MTGGTHPGGATGGSDPLVGRTVLGRYRLGHRLGAGGMGAVYEAEQLVVGRSVAVKVLRSDLTSHQDVRDRFKREAEVIGRLRHPHTIQLIDYGETDGLVVMVTELLLGQPLDGLIEQTGGLSLVDTLRIGEQIAGSLAEAHAYGLVHRDLKPANVFITRVSGEPFAKVLDFGIARVMDESATQLTSTGQIFGTPRYMAPEQGASTSTVDGRADLYSLGLILFECAAGAPPFHASTALQYLAAHSMREAPRLRERRPDAPEGLEDLIASLLAKSPDDRPPSAEQVRQTLASFRSQLRGEATEADFSPLRPDATAASVAPTRRAGRPPQGLSPSGWADTAPSPQAATRRRRGWALMGAVALVVVAGIGVWGSRARSDRGAGARAGVAAGAGAADEAPAVGEAAAVGANSEVAGDAGVRDADGAPAVGETDAGRPSAASAGSEAAERAPAPRRRRASAPKPKSPGIVSGPRGIELDVSEPVIDLVELGRRCRSSEWSGLATLTTEACPEDCALLVDAMCAGRTPASDRAIAPGPRSVVLVCGGETHSERKVSFRAGQTTTINCSR